MRRKTNGTVDRYFLWDNGQLVLEVDGSGTGKIAEYAYSGTDKPLAVWEGTNAAPYFYSHDERGNTTGLTSGSSVLESRHFSPWGVEEFGASIPENSKFGWKGLPWEAGIANLYYVRARWYDPQSRGFISEDPIGLAGGINTYAYADNDPVNGWDPTGLESCKYVHIAEAVVTVGPKNGQHTTSIDPGYWTWQCDRTTGGGDDSGSANSGGTSTSADRKSQEPDWSKYIHAVCKAATSSPGTVFIQLNVSAVGLLGFTGARGWYAAPDHTYGTYFTFGVGAGADVGGAVQGGVNFGGLEGLSFTGSASAPGLLSGSVSVGSVAVNLDYPNAPDGNPNGQSVSAVSLSPSITFAGGWGPSALKFGGSLALTYTHLTPAGKCQ